MKLQLSDFEEHIDPVILDRGRDYWKQEAVDRIYKSSDGTVKAVVYGSEIYHVRLKLLDSTVDSYSCDCPYDYGPVCKHIAAVLYELSASENRAVVEIPKLREVLEGRSKDELINIIEEIIEQEEGWSNLLLARYAGAPQENNFAYYKNVLKSSLELIEDRFGFIGYRQAENAAETALRLLDTAETAIVDSEFEQALTIIEVVIVTMHETLSYSDDSNGYISGSIEQAIHLLRQLSLSNPPPDITGLLFDLITREDLLKKLSDFSWDWDLLHLGIPLVKNENDTDKLLKAAEGCVSGIDGWSVGYAEEQYAILQLELIERRQPRREADKFMKENIQHPAFRRMVLQQHYEKKEYDHLLHVAKEGIEQHKDSAPGLVRDWNVWIVKGAKQAGDTETLREVLEKLYFSCHDLEYYKKLKSTFPAERWPKKRDDILSKLESAPYGRHQLCTVYIEEGLKEKLWNHLSKDLSLEALAVYDEHLLPDFSSEIAAAYTKMVIPALERQKGRTFYAKIAALLSRLRKAGEKEKVKEIVNGILLRFRNRPALKDELKNFRLL